MSGHDSDLSGHPCSVPLIFGLTRRILSGVDVFVTALVRWLVSAGDDARILFTASDVTDVVAVPFDVLETSPDWDWHRRWDALRKYLAARSPCIFVANYDTEYSVGLLPPPPNTRIVLTVQSDDPQHYGHVMIAGHVAERIVAVSTAIAEHIGVIAPALKTRTVVIPNGVDLPPRPRVRDAAVRPLRAIYAGRIVAKQKNVPDLVRAVARVKAIETLTLIGEGSAEPSVLFWSMLDGSDVRLLTTLPHDSLAEQYEAHDVALLHSSYEGLPLMVLEAMSHGCIPICRFIRSGLPELIEHGTNGFFYDSVDDLSSICRVLSRDGHARRRIAAAAYETIVAREGDAVRPYARYAALFEEVARGMAPSPWAPR